MIAAYEDLRRAALPAPRPTSGDQVQIQLGDDVPPERAWAIMSALPAIGRIHSFL